MIRTLGVVLGGLAATIFVTALSFLPLAGAEDKSPCEEQLALMMKQDGTFILSDLRTGKSWPAEMPHSGPVSIDPEINQVSWVALSNTEKSPYHTGNVDLAIQELRRHSLIRAEPSYLSQGRNPGRIQLCIRDPMICFTAIPRQGDAVHLPVLRKEGFWSVINIRDVLGRQYEVKVRPAANETDFIMDTNSLRLQTSGVYRAWTRKRIWNWFRPSQELSHAELLAMLRQKYAESQLPSLNANQLAYELSKIQMERSETRKHLEGPKLAKFESSLVSAYQLVTGFILNNETLSRAHLDRLNWLVNQGANPHFNDSLQPYAGVMRGTNHRLSLRGDQLIHVDTRRFHHYMAIDVNDDILAFQFYPPENVPAAIDELLERIHGVNERTDPTAIFSLARDYILIHPHMDGNGRSEFVLLNAMLTKAHLPPLSVPPMPLYLSPEEMFLFYAKNVLKIDLRLEYGD